jgi:hypothetical protein
MSCAPCGDKGIIRLRYHDGAEDEFGVCVCQASHWYRSDMNAGKHTGIFGWQVWAAREQVDPWRVFFIEELLDDDEMALQFPDWRQSPLETSVTDIAAAMRTRPGPRL